MGNVDRAYMERALKMAFAGMGSTSPNPSVGAVLVRDDEIISTGATCACGGDHAEVCALKNAGARAEGGDLYVTLEPCCHHGRTPPCTDALIASGIRRVIVPVLDPNPHVAGKGVERLRSAGVEVIMMEDMASEARDLNPSLREIHSARPAFRHPQGGAYARRADRDPHGRFTLDFQRFVAVHRTPPAFARRRDHRRQGHGGAGRSRAHRAHAFIRGGCPETLRDGRMAAGRIRQSFHTTAPRIGGLQCGRGAASGRDRDSGPAPDGQGDYW